VVVQSVPRLFYAAIENLVLRAWIPYLVKSLSGQEENKVAVNVTMPKWGLTMKAGKISKWFKSEGDTVAKGEPFFEVETEKITNVVEATASGVVFQIVVPAGTTVPVGTIVAVIAAAGEQPERIAGIQAGEAGAEKEAAPGRPAAAPVGKPEKKEFVPSSPAARRLAGELGVDLSLVTGSGPNGRITEADVKRFHEERPPAPRGATPLAAEMIRQAGLDISAIEGSGEGGKITRDDVQRYLDLKKQEKVGLPVRSIPFSGMRRSIAANMHASLHNTAQLTMFTEVDATEMTRFRDAVREAHKKDDSVKISFNDIIILAVSRALKHHPIMNSTLVGEEILLHDKVHIGVAVALPAGLIVPVIRDADQKGLLEIAREARRLAAKARQGTLTVDEVTGGTFTISNMSMFQVDGVTPILKSPETGILGVGRIKTKPAVYNGEIAIRSMMFVSLTFDHQVVDGAPAGEFLETVVHYLENPYLILT
jgi:pyruvate dehydrogenase E2 component (dihydrolipoamide acetyltransferase)